MARRDGWRLFLRLSEGNPGSSPGHDILADLNVHRARVPRNRRRFDPSGSQDLSETQTLFAPTNNNPSDPNGGIVAGGKVTILSSGAPPNPMVYSVDGSLAIISEGAGIDQEGYLAAPLGSISLSAPNGRVYLGSGSTTTVAAGNAPLLYGVIQMGTDANSLGNNIWAIPERPTPVSYTQVQNVPTQSVSLNGNEVIVGQGATVDISGGSGSIFASRFLPSYSGTNDPLAGSYVIVPDGSVTLPGAGRLSLRQEWRPGRHLFAPACRLVRRRKQQLEPHAVGIPARSSHRHRPEDHPVDKQGDPHRRWLPDRRRIRDLHGHEYNAHRCSKRTR